MLVFDSHMALTILAVAAVGGVIGLDRTAFGQFMVSQPIVAAPIVGWMLGDPTPGLVIGAALELIWVLDMPVGSFVPADATICAVSATAIAALGGSGSAQVPAIGASILLTTIMVPITMWADGLVRTWNARLFRKVEEGNGQDTEQRLVRVQYTGLAVFFLKPFLLYLVLVPAGIAALVLLTPMPDPVMRALTLFVKLLPVLGTALVVRKLSVRVIDPFLLMGFALSLLIGQLFHAPMLWIVLLITVCGWVGVRYRESRQ